MIDVAEQYRRAKKLEKISNILVFMALFVFAIFIGLIVGVEVGKEQIDTITCLENLRNNTYENYL